ncbi:MAG: tetratricopeptide repeat protein, partial [Bacteroidia bacterium]
MLAAIFMRKLILLIVFISEIATSQTDQTEKFWLDKGRASFENKEYKAAIKYYKEVIKLFPDSATGYYLIAGPYQMLGLTKEALENVSKSIKLNPENALAFFDKGIIEVKLGFYTEAISDYTKAIEIDSTDYKSYYNRAKAEISLNRIEEGID